MTSAINLTPSVYVKSPYPRSPDSVFLGARNLSNGDVAARTYELVGDSDNRGEASEVGICYIQQRVEEWRQHVAAGAPQPSVDPTADPSHCAYGAASPIWNDRECEGYPSTLTAQRPIVIPSQYGHDYGRPHSAQQPIVVPSAISSSTYFESHQPVLTPSSGPITYTPRMWSPSREVFYNYNPRPRSPTSIYVPPPRSPSPTFVYTSNDEHSQLEDPIPVSCVPSPSPSLRGLQLYPGSSHGNGTRLYPNGTHTQRSHAAIPSDVIGSYLDHLSYDVDTVIVPRPHSQGHSPYQSSSEHLQVAPEDTDSIRPSLLTKLFGRKQKAKIV